MNAKEWNEERSHHESSTNSRLLGDCENAKSILCRIDRHKKDSEHLTMMLSSLKQTAKLSPRAILVGASSRAESRTPLRFFSSPVPDIERWQKEGFLDDQGLTRFDTLHEMVDRSTQVFADKQLFGTYSDKSKEFEWMTFSDYRFKIQECRSLLQDLGMCPLFSSV